MIQQFVFYVTALLLIGAATMMIITRNPVRSALYLILAFFASAILWMLLQAEFLSLVLIFVYVGAVMTLFLFVVMMLNIDLAPLKQNFVRYLPFALIVLVVMAGLMILALIPEHLASGHLHLAGEPASYSNTTAIGTLLFTKYLYPFELAAVLLLVAILAAISLAFHGRKPGTKSQDVSKQHAVTKAERLKIIDMKADKS